MSQYSDNPAYRERTKANARARYARLLAEGRCYECGRKAKRSRCPKCEKARRAP